MKLGTYPYTFARVSVMKTTLLRADDYQRLMKMGPNEIISFLQESAYRAEVSEFGVSEEGIDLMELALNKHMENTVDKLRRISRGGLLVVMNEYLKRYDVEDVKTILRAKFVNEDKEVTNKKLLAVGKITRAQWNELLDLETVADVVRALPALDFNDMKSELALFEKKGTMSFIEEALDREYYQELLEFTHHLPRGGTFFRSYIDKEMQVRNIINILRLKRVEGKETLMQRMLFKTNPAFDKRLSVLMKEPMSNAADALKGTEYASIVAESMNEFEETGSLIPLETRLYAHVLQQTTSLHKQHPLSVDFILGFLFAKEMEVRNIKTLLRGKSLDVDPHIIEAQLVMRNG